MPVQWVTQFLSSRQTSSPTAHHRTRRARQDVSATHGIPEVDEPRFQSRIALVPESVAKMPTTTLIYRRRGDSTRSSAPPAVSSDRQPLGTIDSGVVITIDSDNCELNCSALERRREDYCCKQMPVWLPRNPLRGILSVAEMLCQSTDSALNFGQNGMPDETTAHNDSSISGSRRGLACNSESRHRDRSAVSRTRPLLNATPRSTPRCRLRAGS